MNADELRIRNGFELKLLGFMLTVHPGDYYIIITNKNGGAVDIGKYEDAESFMKDLTELHARGYTCRMEDKRGLHFGYARMQE